MTPTITTWPSLTRPAEGRTVSLRAFVQRVRRPKRHATKGAVGRWSGSEFREGYRDLAHFLRAHVVVLDLDEGTVTRDQVQRAFADLYVLAHTTWTPGRWRVAVVLDRPVTVHDDEFGRVQRACIEVAERHDLQPELRQSAAHCFALPALGGAPYAYVECAGAFFDVSVALERFPKPAPLPAPERRPVNDGYERLLERARKYLAAKPGAIAGSGGHRATFAAAQDMVRGFGLAADDALRLLVEEFNPRCAPPWSLPELRHKVRQAHQRSRLPHGYLAERARDGGGVRR